MPRPLTSRAARIALVVVGVAAAATLSACGGSKSTASGKPTIVASTDVWGSVATAIAGPDAQVTSIITSPTDDPHSYQTTPIDAAHIQDASLVIYNGGDYDEFASKAAAGRDKPTIDAFALRPADVANDDNEHVWYDMDTVHAVASKIADDLGSIDKAHAQGYTDRAIRFESKLKDITTITDQIADNHPGAPVLQTEPLAHYLLLAAEADDRTPHSFEEAIEQGTDPAPADLATVREMLSAKKVRALVYNIQTEDKTTQSVAAAAKAAGVPVVDVTETLPQGADYLTWQIRNAKALAAALS
ncbi:metal ABC transporter solute-binding protein, Zn/Mn family [Nocardia alni]|uniref:metal ABC transporter solute-binding protein, Zn/Mn family n=1 Tax=Nocardia alni TaxID=2815723 RepID=UPI001C238E84|nr:zinc ABC transporter substrate-binding protein [Nocardia alni]